MRSFVKVVSLGLLGLLAACSGSEGGQSPDGQGQGQGQGAPAAAATASSSSSGGSSGSNSDSAKDERASKINDLVAGAGHLTTSLAADPEPVKEGEPKEENVSGSNGNYICKYTNYSLTKVPEKFVALNPNADVLWPGSVVQGKSMAGGILDPVPVKRAPGTITLTLASGGTGSYSKTMEHASLSAAIQAQNEILNEYTGATPAKFSYEFQSIYSSEQLAVAVNANVKGTNWSAAASLKVDTNDEKSRVLIQFSQEYFTMAFEPPQGAAGVFDPSVTDKDLAPYAQDGNPPVYVSGVTYGRIFYILFESSASQKSLEAAVSGSYSGAISVDAAAQADWKKTINSSTIKAYGLGGNAEMAINAVTGADQFEQVKNFLTTGANFSAQNPGVPISYTIRHLTDSSQVRLALTTEYTAKDCTPTSTYCDAQKHTLDKCGVCGGDGTSCDDCAAGTVQRKPDGSYVNFNAPAGKHGQEMTFPDGHYYKYNFPRCYQVNWGNIRLTCKDGAWTMTSGNVTASANCDIDSNESWSGGDGRSISTGWQP